MSNREVIAIREFRRFACLYIYPENIYKVMVAINKECNTMDVSFNPLPQPVITFTSGIQCNTNSSDYTIMLHNILIRAFINFFNDPDIVKLIRNKIYTNITCEAEKEFINNALNEIQSGNPKYLGLLFNLTILKDNKVYVYL